MRRRRLRLRCSSDEEEEEEGEEEEHRIQTTETLSTPNPTSIPLEDLPFEISDDDFLDVPENLSPPSPPAPIPNQSFQQPAFSSSANSDSPIDEFLRNQGLKLRREWLHSCLSCLTTSVPDFASLNVADKAKLCFEQFLFSDMNYSGGGVLPESVHAMHLADLAGPFVLQVDEIVNVSCPLRDRYQNANAGVKRCLKLSMTDGVQRVFGMEYRPIKDLEVLAPAGLKVSIRNVNIRHGLLMLVPEVLEVLGGLVEDLDAARQRLVYEVNKPPRGKRTRTGEVPSLASRATLAAWSSYNDNNNGHANGSTLQNTTPFLSSDQAATLGASGIDTRQRTAEQFTVSNNGPNAESNQSSNLAVGIEDMNMTDVAVPGIDTNGRIVGEFEGPNSDPQTEPNPSPNVASNIGEIDMVDVMEHRLVPAGDREIPFTYLASLLAKWAAKKDEVSFIQGKIKCFLTGVKGFQFKKRTTFELHVYVDDGSLISEVLIDHSVVQKGIGHSPVEVTAALSSSDKNIVSDMKETMKKFQIFLANFEGTMLVEINRSSPLPVALEMNQGCSLSDAWLLLRRLNRFASSQTPQHNHTEPINISP